MQKNFVKNHGIKYLLFMCTDGFRNLEWFIGVEETFLLLQ
jgi:hypothetical protein